jgi:hypothetical protein
MPSLSKYSSGFLGNFDLFKSTLQVPSKGLCAHDNTGTSRRRNKILFIKVLLWVEILGQRESLLQHGQDGAVFAGVRDSVRKRFEAHLETAQQCIVIYGYRAILFYFSVPLKCCCAATSAEAHAESRLQSRQAAA